MNELQKYFPNNSLDRIFQDFIEIHDWQDFERRFLQGDGKSPHTTRNYLSACKHFYDFTGGLHPMQAGTAEYIEQYYDSLIARGLDIDTAAGYIRGLRYMYKRISERIPFYTSPFATLASKLNTKINRTKKDESERDSLTAGEYQRLLGMLSRDTSLLGKQNYALVRFAVVSGLRNAEMCALTWGQISDVDGVYHITLIGKGGKKATITVEDTATITALKNAFWARWQRRPGADDLVLNKLDTGRTGKSGAAFTTAGIRARVSKIVEAAKAAGIVRQNLIITPHVFRHTCATLLLANGIDIYSVQAHMRHSDIKTTIRYLHNAADKTEALAKMNGEAAA